MAAFAAIWVTVFLLRPTEVPNKDPNFAAEAWTAAEQSLPTLQDVENTEVMTLGVREARKANLPGILPRANQSGRLRSILTYRPP